MAKEMTIAWKWVNRLDENSSPAITTKMQDDAVAVVEERGEYVYIFEDGSSVYEKRRGDWYPAGTYIQCGECDEYFNQDNATSGDNLCDQCVENRADAVEEAEGVSD
jgi:hypothetical protein